MNELIEREFTKLKLIENGKMATVNYCYDIINRPECANNRMSEYQLRYFVLNETEHCTSFGKYKQAKAELETRFNALIEYHYLYNKDRAESMKYEWIYKWANRLSKIIGWFKGVQKFAENEVNVRKLRAESIKREINHKLYEMEIFNDEVQRLLPKFEGVEETELESQYWYAKKLEHAKKEIAEFEAKLKGGR